MKELLFKKYNIFILFVILLVGLYLRLNNLTFYSFWYDELFSMDFSNPNRNFLDMIKLTVEDVHPPFYQIILWIWLKLFGFTEFSARFLSVVIGVLTILVSYFFAKEFYEEKLSLTVSFIFSINFLLIWYSQETRSYQLTVLLSMLSYLYLYKYLIYKDKKNIYIYLIITILWMYTHYFSFFIIATQFLFILFFIIFFADNKKELIKIVLITGVIFLISLSPLLPYIIEISNSNKFYFLAKPDPLYFLNYMNMYFGHGSIYFLLFSFLLNIFFLITNNLTKKEKIFLSMFLFWLIFGYLLLYLKSIYSFSLVQLRYTIVMIPPIIILSVFGISKLNKYLKFSILLLFVIFSSKVLFIDNHYTYKQNFRDVIKYVANYNEIPIYDLQAGNGHNGNNTNHFQVYSDILKLDTKVIDDSIFRKQYHNKNLPKCFWIIYTFDSVALNSLENLLDYFEVNSDNSLNILYTKKYYKAEATLISMKKNNKCNELIKILDKKNIYEK